MLVRAVWRVWKAHERGKLLERVGNGRLVREWWDKWQEKLTEERRRNGGCLNNLCMYATTNQLYADLAVAFSLRASSSLAASSLQKWRQVSQSHRNADAFATQCYDTHLVYQVVLAWRLKRREHLQQLKVAKKAEKFITLRNTWRTWQDKIAARRREYKLKKFETKIAAQYLRGK